MVRTTGYSLAGYGGMITDRVRLGAYTRALEQAVRPGCRVLDLGAGTGIFSLLACRFGAGHVDAVEPDEVIQVARVNAEANGFADRISIHQAVSTEVTTSCFSSICRTARATFSGPFASSAVGMPVDTLQSAQARVQISTMIMKLACFCCQQPPIFGQPASSHTVTRLFDLTMLRVSR